MRTTASALAKIVPLVPVRLRNPKHIETRVDTRIKIEATREANWRKNTHLKFPAMKRVSTLNVPVASGAPYTLIDVLLQCGMTLRMCPWRAG
jgi:hypothetical protein